MSPEEASSLDLGIEYMLKGPLNDQFYIKPEERTKYKNQSLMDQLISEKSRLSGELAQLQQKQLQYSQGIPGTPQYAAGQLQLKDVNSRAGQINARLSKIDSDAQKESKDATTYTHYTLLDRPPPAIHAKLLDLAPAQRDQAEEVLQNYGYSSKEFRQFARGVTLA